MGKITTLTDEQRAALAPYAQAWIERVLTCGPADRASVEDGIRRCYAAAGIPWHGNVVWVRSPLVAAMAGPIASAILARQRDAVDVAVDGAVRVAVDGAVRGAVGDAVRGAVGGAVDGAVDGAVGVAVGVVVGVAVDDAVDDAVRGAVDGAVGDAVLGAVGDAVDGAVRSAVHDAVHDAVDGAVDGAVRGAVDGAVDGAVRGAWWRHLSPWWSWDAWRAACVEIVGVPAVQHLVDALRDANGAGWWWPHQEFVIVSDRPDFIHRERVAADGWGSHRLHCATGPAIRWGAEWAIWSWHGTTVPQWVVEAPTVERIAAEPNTEIRRCAIESFGWDRYLAALDVSPIDACDDPGNPGHRLELFDLPDEAQPFDERVRLLVMRNASRDRDGIRRTFAETVPADIGSALAAAAWQFDVDPSVYARLERAS